MIPVYCIEEHHEAFYYWGVAIEKGYISKKGNILFHVDHHDDMQCGGYIRDFTKPFQSLEERKKFTYEELGIADFIVPAVYEGIFTEIYNMKKLLPNSFKHYERFVKRIGDNALIVEEYIPFLHATYRREENEEYRFFSYYEGSLTETQKIDNVVLDIDLDYFCWDDSLQTVQPKQIEITKEAYEEFQDNLYHPFRILPRRLLKVEEIKGKFYLRYEEPVIWEKKVDEARIQKRISNFIDWLEKMDWEPKIITICRSVYSGYLPAEYANLVEKCLKTGLEQVYKNLEYQN